MPCMSTPPLLLPCHYQSHSAVASSNESRGAVKSGQCSETCLHPQCSVPANDPRLPDMKNQSILLSTPSPRHHFSCFKVHAAWVIICSFIWIPPQEPRDQNYISHTTMYVTAQNTGNFAQNITKSWCGLRVCLCAVQFGHVYPSACQMLKDTYRWLRCDGCIMSACLLPVPHFGIAYRSLAATVIPILRQVCQKCGTGHDRLSSSVSSGQDKHKKFSGKWSAKRQG
jgi:hypothetical protein